VLIHDAAVTTDTRLVASVAAAARITIANARLQAESRERADAIAASRLRLSLAVDEQRRRVERELRLGAAARLDSVAALVAGARHHGPGSEDIVALETELAVARADLDALGRGVYPAVLSERGLVAALDDLARRTPIPLSLRARVGTLEPEVEAAVYFTCAESLSNVAKHASASQVTVGVSQEGADLVVTIVDDGVGGASLGAGSGLQGLVDRVESIGGRLRVDSRPGAGTRLTLTVPAAFSPRAATA
jgi:signal transduction histidine kinase